MGLYIPATDHHNSGLSNQCRCQFFEGILRCEVPCGEDVGHQNNGLVANARTLHGRSIGKWHANLIVVSWDIPAGDPPKPLRIQLALHPVSKNRKVMSWNTLRRSHSRSRSNSRWKSQGFLHTSMTSGSLMYNTDHEVVKGEKTRSPTSKLLTATPISSTMPVNSCPYSIIWYI